MMNEIFIITKNVDWKFFNSREMEHIQKSNVVVMEGYFDIFGEVGIIPDVYAGKETPDIIKDTEVSFIEAKNIMQLMDKMVDKFGSHLHLRFIGHRDLCSYLTEVDDLKLLKSLFPHEVCISVVNDGVDEFESELFPIYNVVLDKDNIDLTLPSLSKRAKTFAVAAAKELKSMFLGKNKVTDREHARRWNTCLTCPLLTPEQECSECGCNMKLKVHFRSAGCGDEEDPKW